MKTSTSGKLFNDQFYIYYIESKAKIKIINIYLLQVQNLFS